MFLCVWGQRSKQKEAEPSTCARLHAEREMMKRGERLGNGRPEPRFSSSSVYKAAQTALSLAGLSCVQRFDFCAVVGALLGCGGVSTVSHAAAQRPSLCVFRSCFPRSVRFELQQLESFFRPPPLRPLISVTACSSGFVFLFSSFVRRARGEAPPLKRTQTLTHSAHFSVIHFV